MVVSMLFLWNITISFQKLVEYITPFMIKMEKYLTMLKILKLKIIAIFLPTLFFLIIDSNTLVSPL